jgi:broad specificity phosphatase PhoE
MTHLFLIRHGDNDFLKKGVLVGNTPGIKLNQHGHEQALALRDSLKGLSISAIYSSPLERAISTAAPLAESLKLEVSIHPGLTDTDVGEWTLMRISDLQKLPAWKQVQASPSTFRFPGGDSFVDLQSRLVRAVGSIVARHRGQQSIAIFFHSDPIKLVIAHYIGLPLDQFQKLTVDTGSVSILEMHAKTIRLWGLNLKPPVKIAPVHS